MARGAKGAASAAAAAAAEVASSRGVPPNIAHGVRVTLAFFVVYYAFLFAQGTLKRKLRAYYAAQGKKFDRYFSRDRKMLGWDRTVGNMHEQMGPFLTLFWANIWLSAHGGFLSHEYVAAAGWLYILLRCSYPVLWFSGGGGVGGTSPLIWRATVPMYLIITTFAVNAGVAIYGA